MARSLRGLWCPACLLGLTILWGILIWGSAPPMAMAQPAAPTLIQAPSSPLIQADSVHEIVEQFSPTTQLYIKGQPLRDPEINSLLEILEQHPNVFVVLIDHSLNVRRDDLTLSREIGNSPAFQSVVHPSLGERQGVLFMIYFDSPQGRQIYMRAEALPDRLGMGETQFADAQGNPRPLLRLFIDGVRDQGLSVPLALERVIGQINGTIAAHVEEQIQARRTEVEQATAALERVEEQLAEFQDHYGLRGEVGDPPIEQWWWDLERMQQALDNQQFEQVASIYQSLMQHLKQQQSVMFHYDRSAEQIGPLSQQYQRLQEQLSQLQDNAAARQAQWLVMQAQASLDRFTVSYGAGDLEFLEALESAQAQIQDLEEQIQASLAQTQLNRGLGMGATAGGWVLGITGGAVAYLRSAQRRRWAQQEWQEAQGQIGAMTQELLRLMDEADYRILVGYRGETQRRAEELIERVTEALTLISGAEKFLTEAQGLLQPRSPWDWLTTHRSTRALTLLTDPEMTLPFSITDSSRAVMEKERVESWQEWSITQKGSRVFQRSLQQVLSQMAENRDQAQVLLDLITHKSQGLEAYLDGIATQATQIQKQWSERQSQADEWFTIPALEQVLTRVLAEENMTGLIAMGRAQADSDPIGGWDEYGQRAAELTQVTAQILQLSDQARTQLLPQLRQAQRLGQQEGLDLAWIEPCTQILSDQLNEIAHQADQSSVSEDLSTYAQALEDHQHQIELTIQYSQHRSELVSHLIPALELQIQAAREQISQTLQQRGLFQSGTSEQSLRQPASDPTKLISAINDDLRLMQIQEDLDTRRQQLEVDHQIQHDECEHHRATQATLDAEAAITQAQQQLTEMQSMSLSRKTDLDLANRSLQSALTSFQAAQDKLVKGAYKAAQEQAQTAKTQADRASRQVQEAQSFQSSMIGTSSSWGGESSGSTGGGFHGGGSGSTGGGW